MIGIAVSNISKTYYPGWGQPAREALKQVSFEVGVGETFGFVGPNGAGKSTLIKVLVGAIRPTGGEASLFGVPVESPRARTGLGFVPENPSLQDHLTPYEILLMGCRLHRLRVDSVRKHCLNWLERFDLGSVSDRPLRGFSKGMMQRTALAHALAISPRLLILDEPLSGLDPVGRKEVVDILAEYRREGGTLFFSSHVLYDVERIADRFGLIHRGELRTVRSPQELVEDQADIYVVRYRGQPVSPDVMSQGGVCIMDVRAGDLSAMIARIQGVGGVVQDVTPKASLETVFFRAIRQGEDAGAA